jgi:hypothetical protein
MFCANNVSVLWEIWKEDVLKLCREKKRSLVTVIYMRIVNNLERGSELV